MKNRVLLRSSSHRRVISGVFCSRSFSHFADNKNTSRLTAGAVHPTVFAYLK